MENQLHPVSSFPAVDLRFTLVSFLMTAEQHERFLDGCSRAIKVTVPCNRVRSGYDLLPAISRPLPSIVLSLPNNLLTIIVSSRDIFAMLVVEYEFWVFTIMNAAYWYVMGGTLGGIRWCACVPCWLSTQLIISVDANIRTLLKMLPSSMIWIPGAICICTVSFIPVIDIDSSHFHSLLPPGRMSLTRIDLLSKLCFFVVRRLHTKRSVLAKEFEDSRWIPCAVILAKLCLRLVSTEPNHEATVREKHRPARRKTCCSARVHPNYATEQTGTLQQQLEFVPRDVMVVDAFHTIALAVPSSRHPPLGIIPIVLLYATGAVGLSLSALRISHYPEKDDGDQAFALMWTALGATVVFTTPFVLSYQRTVVQILTKNLDVLFLWVEAFMAWLGFSNGMLAVSGRFRCCYGSSSCYMWTRLLRS